MAAAAFPELFQLNEVVFTGKKALYVDRCFLCRFYTPNYTIIILKTTTISL
jgi:hypothetical protein